MNKTGLIVKSTFSSIILLSLLISCSKESIKVDQTTTLFPTEIILASSIEFDVKQFLPEKITCDVRDDIYIIGSGTRLIVIKDHREIEEINIEEIYPCEIVDISTDGFDIFLLDRMNRKVWTVKREAIIGKGFPIEGRPLLLSVSEKGLFSIVYSDKRELTIFTKDEKRQNEFLLDNELMEGDGSSLLFSGDVLYYADTKNNKIKIFSMFNPSKKHTLRIKNPTSLALDNKENLFIVSHDELVSFSKDTNNKNTLLPGNPDMIISIQNNNLYVLKPTEKKIDVYKIIYNHSGPDNSYRD